MFQDGRSSVSIRDDQAFGITDLGDEGPLVALPHRQPHQRVSQLFDLLVVVQPFHLSLQVTLGGKTMTLFTIMTFYD